MVTAPEVPCKKIFAKKKRKGHQEGDVWETNKRDTTQTHASVCKRHLATVDQCKMAKQRTAVEKTKGCKGSRKHAH